MDPTYALVPIVAFAFTVETSVGFGGMVISLALGTLVLPIDAILPRLIPLNVALSLVLAIRHGRHADRAYLFRRLLPPVLAAMPIGLLAFERLDRRVLTIAFGLFVLVLAITELRRDGRSGGPKPPLGALARNVFLVLGGVMQGAFSTGGPMVVYVTAREVAPKARFRATLVLAWVTFGVVLLATYVVTGRTNAYTFRDTLALALPLLAGLLLGEHLHTRIDEAVFKRVVYVILLVSALFLLVRGALS